LEGPAADALQALAREAPAPLSQSLLFGDGGRVRFLVTSPLPEKAGLALFWMRVDNEGAIRFTLGKSDRWTAVTSDGTSLPLLAVPDEVLRVEPLESKSFDLTAVLPEGASISKLVYESASGDRRAELSEPFQPAVLEEAPPVPYDAEAAPDRHGEVGYALLVGADGIVQKVQESWRKGGASRNVIGPAAAETIAHWKFRGATQGGKPVPSLAVQYLGVGSPLVLRAVVDAPIDAVRRAVDKYVARVAARAVALPEPGAVVAAIRFADREGWRRGQALLVRTAEENPSRTWISVSASSTFQMDPDDPCDCSWWSTEETGEARKAMTAILMEVKSPASLTALAQPNVRSAEIASGFLACAGDVRLQPQPIARLLRAAIARGRRDEPTSPVPAPEEYAKPGSMQPIPVTAGVVPPDVFEKPNPDYPEAARRAKVMGTVQMLAVIGEDGKVRQLQVIDGPEPLLAPAARAVSCWRARPAVLDGKPIAVYFTTKVKFWIQ